MSRTLFCCFAFATASLFADQTVRPLAFAEGRALSSAATTNAAELVCDNGDDAKATNGWVWSLKLNQQEATPFSVTAESLAEATPGGRNPRDYSLYLDMAYVDGTHLYGQVAEFTPRAQLGWQRRTVTVVPDKPVKFASCYCLFRSTPGRVRFRAPTLKTLEGKSFVAYDTCCQDLAVLNRSDTPRFYLRDAAAERGFRPIQPGGAAVEQVKLAVTSHPGANGATFFDIRLAEQSGQDRAISLVYALPLPGAEPIVWHDSPRNSETLTAASGQRRATTNQKVGEGPLSRWPFGAVTVGGKGLALGYDPSAPAIFRVTANPKTRELLIAFDLGFTREKPDAHFRFVSFAFPGELAFRGALATYQQIFPENHTVRIKKHGLWMAFRKISSVQGWEDFGFAVKEGDNEPAWDDAHGLLTFHYTEPSTWWMTMKGAHGSYTLDDCIAEANRRADAGEPLARAWRAAPCLDALGRPAGAVKDTPWCVGAIWNLSPLPAITNGEYACKLREATWEKRYAQAFPAGVDGEYIDSAEGYVTPPLDFNRAHFAASRTPLAYDPNTKQPGIAKCLAFYEYVRETADRCHAIGRDLMGNGIPHSWPWLVPYSDFGGQETGWINAKGDWRPMSDDDLLYRRAMSGAKPYCFLMNVNFDKFPSALVEKYMQRTLAYGLFASFFSPNASGGHYFSRPELYDRDRPLFRKYVPLCRLVSEAGWRPVNTLAQSKTPGVFVEQFGDRYLTIFNSGKDALTARLHVKRPTATVRERVTDTQLAVTGNRLEFSLPGETVRLFDFGD